MFYREPWPRSRPWDGVSLQIRSGETLGLVGEAGCGKTTLGFSILWLVKPTSGTVLFDGIDLGMLSGARLRKLRQRIQMIFENPYTSLDPTMRVGEIIAEPMQIHNITRGDELIKRAEVLFMFVGLRPDMVERYPGEFR